LITVKKRDNSSEKFDISKIRKQTSEATEGLQNVSKEELEKDIKAQLRNGIKSEEIQNILITIALNKIDIDKPDWSFVASRLFLNDLYHRVGKSYNSQKGKQYSHSLKEYIEYGQKIGRIIKDLQNGYNLTELNSYIQPIRDKQFTYLGIKTLYDRYIIKDKNREPIELPQHMFMAIAMYLAKDEIEKNKRVKEFYDVLSKFEVMLATPTLSNARTPHHQLSSCFVGDCADNIESIFDTYKEMALLSKHGGGIGWNFSKIRGNGSTIRNHKGVGSGIIPFLKPVNDIAIAVDQLGVRAGSINVYTEIWHWDIQDFIELKKNSGEERRRTHDLFTSIWINDLFMERVLADEDWTIFDPHDVTDLTEIFGDEFKERYLYYEKQINIRKKHISAKQLWKNILISYYETGSPFLGFKDEVNRRNLNSHVGIIRSSNLCMEIAMNTSSGDYKLVQNGIVENLQMTKGETAVCNLASVNLSQINSKKDIERVLPTAIRMLDNVISLNYYPTHSTKETNFNYRGIGLGVMGEAQLLAENQIYFGSEEHLKFIDEIMEMISYNAIKSSSDLAKEKGAYPLFKNSLWSKGIVPIDSANLESNKLVLRDKIYNWDTLKEKIKVDGMRNGYLMAIAPTSSISIVSGTTQTIEPIYQRKWYEDNLSGLIPVTAPKLSLETWSYYKSVYEIEQLDIIKAGAIRQKWIDQSQSLNLFVNPENITGGQLHKFYVTAWKLGVKTTYYLRSKSPETNDKIDRNGECLACQ
jgi:ribonucleoside-diphosphate reductase alpha chain